MIRSLQRLAGVILAAFGAWLPALLLWSAPASAQDPASRIIDIHFHAHPQVRQSGDFIFDTDGAARLAVRTMDANGIALAVVMPPPMPYNHRSAYDYPELKRLAAARPGRFAFFGGGGTLNGMIQNADPGAVTAEQRAEFEQTARAILAAGAAGFGELTALHLSLRPGHPFVMSPPDHPLFLLLADIAAERGVPIDLHMEAVARNRPTPQLALNRGQSNPEQLAENISGLERLLAHNRKAPILWSHVGWDNTGHRRPPLIRRLLAQHPNLYMSVKLLNAAASRRQRGDGGAQADPSNPLDADGAVKPGWLALFEAFPDRFLIGSDTHVFVSGRQSFIVADQTAAFIRALPEHLARAIAYENAQRLLRLPRS